MTKQDLSKVNSRVKYYPLARERVMNREYLEAKVDLCLNQAEIDLQQEEIARAIANLRRANSALTQLFGFEEEDQ
jgi:hypothetical protein